MSSSKYCQLFCPDPSKPYYCLPKCYSPPGFSYPPPPPRPRPPPHPDESNQNASLITIIISLLAGGFLVVSIVIVFIRDSNRSSSRTSANPTNNTTHQDHMRRDHVGNVGLEESEINSITVCKYKRDGRLFQGTECSICLNEFHEDESLRLLPNCIHAFHLPCIDTWLKSNVNCPLCRTHAIYNPSNSQEQPQNHIGLERNQTDGFGDNHITVTIDLSALEDSSSRIGELGRSELVDDDIGLPQTTVSMDFSDASMIPNEVPQFLQPMHSEQNRPEALLESDHRQTNG